MMAGLKGKFKAATTDGAGGDSGARAEDVRYMPPASIVGKLVARGKDSQGRETVTMSVQAFNRLMEAALAPVFDETAYLERHADVRAAVRAGTIASALRHYASNGYFEGRAAISCPVDETWYLKTYPDVAESIRTGELRNATEHFEKFGYFEGRVPNANYQRIIGEWREIEQNFPI